MIRGLKPLDRWYITLELMWVFKKVVVGKNRRGGMLRTPALLKTSPRIVREPFIERVARFYAYCCVGKHDIRLNNVE